ncbi:CapA family protein [Alteriqipengyuania lutimaris]|uniref:CapA family protein n=1 Tax=Alteriqipengyuania lutimaris TaxID=1538146 RepID=A0A395LIB6_9SPHN|nr:CapA family protein [Alteriqipengyuania lutimaris]MBB3034380.1 poly-gamma-glutamate synthesis protein (capsule biosynthesis protein) [Alteriqipengyuania lutimaris]RDS76718.1 CapA family protein [Alteriqipengyuania lutimaris]
MSAQVSASLLLCGDICPTDDTRALFDGGNPEALMGGLAHRLRAADLAVANLEFVMNRSAPAAEKIGPVLAGKPRDAQFLAAAGFGMLTCANNHIKDYGEAGVLETLAACREAGLRTTGAGHDAAQAAEPARIMLNGRKIGIFALSEREFNAATKAEAGAHVFDPLTDLETLRALAEECDFVVAIYHGGIEYYQYPSPLLQRTCRSFVRHGADLVLCQHSHVIGTMEAYEGGHILYGQGNCIYGYRAGKPQWNEGLAVSVKLPGGDDSAPEIDLIPIGCDENGVVDLLPPEHAKACLDALGERSRQAEDEVWLEQSWNAFCDRLAGNQLPHVLGLGLWPTRLNRVLGGRLVRMLYNRRQRMIAMNVVRCDAHREVALTAFEQSLGRRDRAIPPGSGEP